MTPYAEWNFTSKYLRTYMMEFFTYILSILFSSFLSFTCCPPTWASSILFPLCINGGFALEDSANKAREIKNTTNMIDYICTILSLQRCCSISQKSPQSCDTYCTIDVPLSLDADHNYYLCAICEVSWYWLRGFDSYSSFY